MVSETPNTGFFSFPTCSIILFLVVIPSIQFGKHACIHINNPIYIYNIPIKLPFACQYRTALMPVMVNTKCLCVKRKTNDTFSNNEYFSFLTLFCPCLLGGCFPLLLWETRLEEVGTRQNESCKLTLFLGGGVLWETCNSHESSCRKALFVTVTLSCRLKRC